MKVTGYKLRNAIQNQCNRRAVLAQQFANSLTKFKGEEKEHPSTVMEAYRQCERDISVLQDVQSRYNQHVMVSLNNQKVSLLFVIKLVGGLGRVEKMWRTALPSRDRYSCRDEDSRNKDTEYATRQMSDKALLEASKEATKMCAAAREAIAIGNATELDLVEVDPGLFE